LGFKPAEFWIGNSLTTGVFPRNHKWDFYPVDGEIGVGKQVPTGMNLQGIDLHYQAGFLG